MFSKLLKHEWKANWGLMSILALAAIGMALVGTIALRVLVNYGDMISESESFLVLLLFPLGMLVGVSFIGLAIYAAAVSFVMMFRFYKNKFTDEGYMTFTLPVNTHQIFLSSALNMLIWWVIGIVLSVILLICMILFGTANDGLINMDIIRALQNTEGFWALMGEIYGQILGDSYGILGLATLVVTPIYSVVLWMTCITLGAVVAKKHKILAAIGISYGASIALNIISSVVSVLPSLILIGNPNPGEVEMQAYFTLSSIMQLLILVGVTVGGYFLSTHLMKHKLNLP